MRKNDYQFFSPLKVKDVYYNRQGGLLAVRGVKGAIRTRTHTTHVYG